MSCRAYRATSASESPIATLPRPPRPAGREPSRHELARGGWGAFPQHHAPRTRAALGARRPGHDAVPLLFGRARDVLESLAGEEQHLELAPHREAIERDAGA